MKNLNQTPTMEAKEVVNKFFLNAMLLTDGYKLGHKLMYPKGMTRLYSNFTPRGNKYFPEATHGVVVFGIQYFIIKNLVNAFNTAFFNLSEEEAINSYRTFLNGYLGTDTAFQIGVDHIIELHRLGYLPLHIKSLKEGTYCPIGVPTCTVDSTHDDFPWFVNYIESILSNETWGPMTSATTADVFKRELIRHAIKTGFFDEAHPENLDFLCHDFSMRGMFGLDATISSGMAHLTSFCGSESVPAVASVPMYYNTRIDSGECVKFLYRDGEFYQYENDDFLGIAGTIPATEHSIECSNATDESGIPDDERYFKNILDAFPSGFISIVADGYDYWHFISVIVPKYKNEIMARNGRVVIRPDSGDPVKIVCGDAEAENPIVRMGSYEFLYATFGGIVNAKGYKVLDTHIGLIYGDSINIKRQAAIYAQLEAKSFAATNLVLGIGSYTYQCRTRDSLAFAMKATYCVVNGKGIAIFKDPKTVTGTPKKSHKGLLCVVRDENGNIVVENNVTPEREASEDNLLKTVYYNGVVTYTNMDEIRKTRFAEAVKAVKEDMKNIA